MNGDDSDKPVAQTVCANCGTTLTDEFCPSCGQSRKSIERSFLALAGEALGDVLQWDGRFLTTYRRLFMRPGRVARDYADGKRQSHTPPVRLYLIISLVFFAAMSFSDIRVVAVDITLDANDEIGTSINLFQPPRDADEIREIIPVETQDRLLAMAEEGGVWEVFRNLARLGMNSPDVLEQRASDSASYALILMVVFFALINAVLHPRRRLIEHAIQALYFHAALLIPLAAIMMVGIWMPWPNQFITLGDTRLPFSLFAAFGLFFLTIIGMFAAFILFDRGFYRSSWLGAVLRSVPMFAGYVFAALLAAIILLVIASLRL